MGKDSVGKAYVKCKRVNLFGSVMIKFVTFFTAFICLDIGSILMHVTPLVILEGCLVDMIVIFWLTSTGNSWKILAFG